MWRCLSTAGRNGAHKLGILMGKPGGGKGTISKWLVKDFGFAHLSTGDMLRSHLERKTDLGMKAQAYMNAGDLVPDEVMVDMVVSVVRETLLASNSPVLLDGFPRTVTQAEALDSSVNVDFVFNLEVPSEEIIGRISDRWIHPSSGRVYSYKFNPPKVEGVDDETGEQLIRRADDEPEAVQHRLDAYHNLTKPVADYYRAKALLTSFDGSEFPQLVEKDRRSEAIYKTLSNAVKSQLE